MQDTRIRLWSVVVGNAGIRTEEQNAKQIKAYQYTPLHEVTYLAQDKGRVAVIIEHTIFVDHDEDPFTVQKRQEERIEQANDRLMTGLWSGYGPYADVEQAYDKFVEVTT